MKKSEKQTSAIFLLGTTLASAVGQLLFKYSFVHSSMFIEWFALAVIAYGLATIAYFYVLSRVHLSWAYGIGGLSYMFTTLLAYFVLVENIPPLRWVGVVIITIGVVMVGFS